MTEPVSVRFVDHSGAVVMIIEGIQKGQTVLLLSALDRDREFGPLILTVAQAREVRKAIGRFLRNKGAA